MVRYIYIEGSQVIISPKNITFLSLKIDFVLANSADPDEMLHYAVFHLGLHCLPKYPFKHFWSHPYCHIQELGVSIFIQVFLYYCTLCMREVKALKRLYRCVPSLIANAM